MLNLIRQSRDQYGMAMIMTTRNISLIWHRPDRIAVTCSGHIVVEGPIRALLSDLAHPWTTPP